MIINRGLIILIITFLIYIPALQNEFVNWDDPRYIAVMQQFQPLNGENIYRAFTGFYISNWHPLAILSHAADYSIWELNPFWHHLENNLLHSINTLLVFLLTFQLVAFRKYGEKQKRLALLSASITALFFGIHPLHVESVAWISERKDLLCALFFLLSLILYLKYYSTNSLKKALYFCSLFFFILALLSKPMAVTLPAVLILIDHYPLGRFSKADGHNKISRLVIEKVPFFTFSLISSILTMKAQAEFGALSSMRTFPLLERLLNAFHSIVFYLVKMFFPFNLAPLYPYPERITFFSPPYFFSFLAVFFITLITFMKLKTNKLYFMMWSCYLVTLLPVIGIIQAGGQAAADRYTYLPGIPVFILAGIAGAMLLEGQKKGTALFAGGSLFFCALFMAIVTAKQTKIWQNSLTLWNHEIKVLPNSSPFIYNNRGNAYVELRRYKEANADFSKAVALGPTYLRFYYSRGASFMELRNYAAAIADFSHIIRIDNENEKAYNSRGAAYHILGRLKKAEKDYERALQLNPNNGRASYNLALIYEERGDREKAFRYFKKAASLGIAEARPRIK